MADDTNLQFVAGIATAWLSNPNTRTHGDDVADMLRSLHAAISGLGAPTPTEAPAAPPLEHTPAVTVRRSLASPDHIISMIDGKPYRALTRHLRTHGLTPDAYRQRYALKPDYPMTAPSYSAARSDAAKQHNFGRMAAVPLAAEAVPAPQPTPEPTPKAKRTRKSVAQAKRDAQAHLGTSDGVAALPSES